MNRRYTGLAAHTTPAPRPGMGRRPLEVEPTPDAELEELLARQAAAEREARERGASREERDALLDRHADEFADFLVARELAR